MRIGTQIKYLEKARDLIANKENWCQGSYAVDAEGEEVGFRERSAVRFCAQGAVRKVLRSTMDHESLIRLLDQEVPNDFDEPAEGCEKHCGHCIIDLNDSSSPHAHRRVVGAFNRTIKKLQSQLLVEV